MTNWRRPQRAATALLALALGTSGCASSPGADVVIAEPSSPATATSTPPTEPPPTPASFTEAGPAHNVILVIADGMGPTHVATARERARRALGFEGWPDHTTMTHSNASGDVTDSAASATAMATGVLVANHVIALELPGSGDELTTVVDVFATEGKAIGLVTTSTATDATPAAFGAHAADRDDDADITGDYLERSRPLVLMGERSDNLTPEAAAAAGYTVAENIDQMTVGAATGTPFAGIFGRFLPPGYPGHDDRQPTLPQMTSAALDHLDDDPDGFFLLLEHEGTDTFADENDLDGVLRSMEELEATLQIVETWVVDHPDTLVIFTADHETGGMQLELPESDGEPAVVTWSTTGHTGVPVPVFALGRGADDAVAGIRSNADVHDALLQGR